MFWYIVSTIKGDNMWYDNFNNKITSIEQMPEGAIGFVYMIEYTDGKFYIGKKNLYSTQTVKALKSGKHREGTVDVVYKNTGKGYRQAFDVVKKESDWLTYQGSHEECKTRTVKKKYILQYAFSKLELTYLEAKELFCNSVLETEDFINDNILGSFYRSNLYGDSISEEPSESD